jgi:transposase-like protein
MPASRLLDDELLARVQVALLNGATIADIAGAFSIAQSTLYNWRARGAEERQRIEDGAEPDQREALFLNFVTVLDESRSLAKLEAIAQWRRAMVGWDEKEVTTTTRTDGDGSTTVTVVERNVRRFDWRAAMTWLERRYHEEYGLRMNREEAAALDDSLGVEPETVEELRARGVAVLERARMRRDAEAEATAGGE